MVYTTSTAILQAPFVILYRPNADGFSSPLRKIISFHCSASGDQRRVTATDVKIIQIPCAFRPACARWDPDKPCAPADFWG